MTNENIMFIVICSFLIGWLCPLMWELRRLQKEAERIRKLREDIDEIGRAHV